jgi:tRNA A-37 threonylcarbamoyl transferase component Bud32
MNGKTKAKQREVDWHVPLEGSWIPLCDGPWKGIGQAELVKSLGNLPLDDPHAWLALPGTETIKDSRNIIARVPRPGPADDGMLLKIFPVRGLRGTVQSGWRTSKARKGWEKAWTVLKRGFRTPTPRLALERHAHGRLIESALWVDWIEGWQLREFLKPWRRRPRSEAERKRCHEFLHRLGSYLRNLHDAGIIHRDFGGGNVLVSEKASGSEAFTLVDLNRAVVTRDPASWRARMLDLERVHLHPEDRQTFFAAYSLSQEEIRRWGHHYLERAERYRRRSRR